MIPLTGAFWATPLYFLLLAVCAFLFLFLFWRAGKHEFVESEAMLDISILGFLGALILGRLFEFLIRFDVFAWHIERTIFFNVWSGFNFWGALFGFLAGAGLFLRKKRIKSWHIFDLAAPPAAITVGFGNLALFVKEYVLGKILFWPLYYFIAYFLLFLILKRLTVKKRHVGFFANFFLVSAALIELVLVWFKPKNVNFGPFPYSFYLGVVILVSFSVFWYIQAKRKLGIDVKNVLSFLLLSIFSFRRTVVSLDESGKIAKIIILSPYYLLVHLGRFLRFLGKEIRLGFFELLISLGIKKYD